MWENVLLWFLTSLFGGIVVQLGNIFFLDKLKRNHQRINDGISRLLEYLKSTGHLIQLYRNYAHYEAKAIQDSSGNKIVGSDGEAIVATRIFDPDDDWLEIISANEGAELDNVIESHKYLIRKEELEINDISVEIDKSGRLQKEIKDLRISIDKLGIYLKYKNSTNPQKLFANYLIALSTADVIRNNVRKIVLGYRK